MAIRLPWSGGKLAVRSGHFGGQTLTLRAWPAVVAALVLSLLPAATAPTPAGADVTQLHDLFGGTVRDIAVAPNNTTVLAGTSQGIFRSIDAGETWSPATSGIDRRD